MAATLIALAVSTVYIALTSLIAYWARRYVDYYIRDLFVKSLFLEGIATAELCGACFELIISKFVIINTVHVDFHFVSLHLTLIDRTMILKTPIFNET